MLDHRGELPTMIDVGDVREHGRIMRSNEKYAHHIFV
jgi:hypothetical protein